MRRGVRVKGLTYQKTPGLNRGTTRLSRLLTSTPRKYPCEHERQRRKRNVRLFERLTWTEIVPQYRPLNKVLKRVQVLPQLQVDIRAERRQPALQLDIVLNALREHLRQDVDGSLQSYAAFVHDAKH